MPTDLAMPSVELNERFIQKMQSAAVDRVVKGDPRPSSAAVRTRDVILIYHNPFQSPWPQVYWDRIRETTGSLEFARDTRHENRDIRSGAPAGWRSALEKADQTIRAAYDNPQPREALRTISTVWEHLDLTSELAAARSSLLMGKIDAPKLAELPTWFRVQEAGLLDAAEGGIGASPLAVETAKLLVQAVLASVEEGENLEAELETGPLGRVTIDWQIPGVQMEWMVEATDLPWPSVKVYQVHQRVDGEDLKPPQTHIFHNAFDVVEPFSELLRA